jgi:hypothetical protein
MAVAASVTACSNETDARATSTVSFQLDFGGGVTLTTVSYELKLKSFHQSGTLTVADQPTVTATFNNLAIGNNYELDVTGTASDGASTCTGQVNFNVTSMTTTVIQVPLTCTGIVSVTGNFNVCPVIDALSATPSEVYVGGSIQLVAATHDADSGPSPLAATWSVAPTGGTLSGLSATGATFTCTAPGTFNVSLQISDGDTTGSCPDSVTLTVTCSPVPSAELLGASSSRPGTV